MPAAFVHSGSSAQVPSGRRLTRSAPAYRIEVRT
jgi:hypothetical protein